MRNIPIGTDDFRKIRRQGDLYVDKSLFIREILNSPEVVLLPRPRRFGKTLNMTMLYAFFDRNQENRALFDGLAITADLAAMAHLNAHPTVFLSFKEIVANDWEGCQKRILEVIRDLMEVHQPFIALDTTSSSKRRLFEAAYDMQAPISDLVSSLHLLTELLFLSTGKKVIVLIDEYDTPIHQGHANGYYPQIINFMRSFLGKALKGNDYLERAVITGILRVAKESIYSGLNNISVHSVLSPKFAPFFGFTEAEVRELLLETISPHSLEEVQAWYNGYRFGQETIYNPWSILKMLEMGANPLHPYWIGTSSNELIGDLIKTRTAIKTHQLESLLRGQSLKCLVEESVAMVDITPQSIWTLLLFSGYLTAQSYDPQTGTAVLRLPNLEVRSFFESRVKLWLGDPDLVFELIDHLLALQFKDFVDHLAKSIKSILSYHDIGARTEEKTYHVLMVGLLASLSDRYEVLSNRESGYGRYDLALMPRQLGLPGFIFEFKKANAQSLVQTATEALDQILEKSYATTMRQAGVATIASIGLAFFGKRVALASSLWELSSDQSKVARYSAGNDEPDAEQPQTAADHTQRAMMVGKIQALQQTKGKAITPETTLLNMDLAGLKALADALTP